jgi:hypothetical protein
MRRQSGESQVIRLRMIRVFTILGGLLVFGLIFLPLMLFIGLNYDGQSAWVVNGATLVAAAVAGVIAFAAVRGSLRCRPTKHPGI